MSSIIDFLVEYSSVISAFFSVLVAVVCLVKTRNIKNFKEVLNLIKYRTPNYRDLDDDYKSQDFLPNLKPVYRLNKATNTLERTDDFIDVDELIQSHCNDSLKFALDRFTAFSDEVDKSEYEHMTTDLDYLLHANEVAETYRSRFGLSEFATVAEIYAEVDRRAKKLKERLSDEKKTISQSEPPKLPQDGEKD